ncbi:uncharacterized protein [Callorhinus ursinus]|uniref:uncharacterized protein n=1 Tax=Callorhinus ursinus TaxID=34884 RepID=UPI003CD01AFF
MSYQQRLGELRHREIICYTEARSGQLGSESCSPSTHDCTIPDPQPIPFTPLCPLSRSLGFREPAWGKVQGSSGLICTLALACGDSWSGLLSPLAVEGLLPGSTASGSSSPLGSACLARSRHNLHCSSSETWLDIAVTFDLLAGRGQIHWSFCGTQKTLTSGADFTQDSLDVLGSLLPLQNPLPFLCTSSSAMRPQTWWRRKRKFHGTQTGREPRKGTSRSFCRRKQRPGQGEVTGARRRPLGVEGAGRRRGWGLGGEWNGNVLSSPRPQTPPPPRSPLPGHPASGRHSLTSYRLSIQRPLPVPDSAGRLRLNG